MNETDDSDVSTLVTEVDAVREDVHEGSTYVAIKISVRTLPAFLSTAARAKVLVSFEHSRTAGKETKTPSLRQYEAAMKAFHKAYPRVKEINTWNEVNACQKNGHQVAVAVTDRAGHDRRYSLDTSKLPVEEIILPPDEVRANPEEVVYTYDLAGGGSEARGADALPGLACALMWGVSPVLIKAGMQTVPSPVAGVTLSTASAGLVYAVGLHARGQLVVGAGTALGIAQRRGDEGALHTHQRERIRRVHRGGLLGGGGTLAVHKAEAGRADNRVVCSVVIRARPPGRGRSHFWGRHSSTPNATASNPWCS